jgi:4-aminobutyrate--pyruvate transaminase
LKVGLGFGEHALRHGIIVRPLGDMIALSPPLIITAAEVDVLIDGLRAALDDTAAALTAPPASLAG